MMTCFQMWNIKERTIKCFNIIFFLVGATETTIIQVKPKASQQNRQKTWIKEV